MDQLIAKFKDTETKYNELRAKLGRGEISGQQLKEELKRLMVQDRTGKYWMLGGKSGKWYIHDGKQWLESDPYEQFQPVTEEPVEPEVPILQQEYQVQDEQQQEQEQVLDQNQELYLQQQQEQEQALEQDQELYLQQQQEQEQALEQEQEQYRRQQGKDEQEELSFEYTQQPRTDQQVEQPLDNNLVEQHSFSTETAAAESETAALDGYSDETRLVDSHSYQDQEDMFKEEAQTDTEDEDNVEENFVAESHSFADSLQQAEESPGQESRDYEASEPKDRYQQYADMLGYDEANSEEAGASETFPAKDDESPLFPESDLDTGSTETPFAADSTALTDSEPLQPVDSTEDTRAFAYAKTETQQQIEPKDEPAVAGAPDTQAHPAGKVDLDYITCKTCRSRIPPYANFCTFCGATLAQSEIADKARKAEPESELLIKSLKLTSFMFFLGGLGLIAGVILGATFGIFKDFLTVISGDLPMMLQETRGGIAGGMIFAAIGGIAGFIASAILSLVLGGIYNLISFIFGGLRFKIKQ